MNLKIVERNRFDEVILSEPRAADPLKIGNVLVEPLRVLKVELIADIRKRRKNLMSPCVVLGPCGYGVL